MNYLAYMYTTVVLAAILRVAIKDDILYMLACFVLGVSMGIFAGLSRKNDT